MIPNLLTNFVAGGFQDYGPREFPYFLQVEYSQLSMTDTFGTGTKCPFYRGVRLIESQIKGLKKGRDQL